MSEKMPCPKCRASSGDDWEQCKGPCPMPGSPHYTPAPEGEAFFDAPNLALLLDYLDGKAIVVPAGKAPSMKAAAAAIRWLMALVEEQRAGQKQMGVQMDRLQDLVGQTLYVSSVVPVASGQADKMALVLRGMVKRGTLIDAEAIDRALKLATYKQDPDDDDRAWAASQAEVIGQPVVPVGVSREEIARIIAPELWAGWEGYPLGQRDALAKADAILAALRPTDTGWRDIATAPRDGTRILIAQGKWFTAAHWGTYEWSKTGPRWWWDNPVAFFDCDHDCPDHDGQFDAKFYAPSHWMPLPSAPTDTGRE